MKVKSSRRHDSLIPLSREHQYALLLCLRIHRGLPERGQDRDWLMEKRGQVLEFYEGDMRPHFQAEEGTLFPAMREFAGARLLLDELVTEHRKMGILVLRLQFYEGKPLADALKEFADLLESHIRKEERRLFPIYEHYAHEELTQQVGWEIVSRIGDASQPKAPELLK